MSIAFLTLLSLAAAQHAMKGVPFGRSLPVKPLFPATEIIEATENPQFNETSHGLLIQHAQDDPPSPLDTNALDDEDVSSLRSGHYLPYHITDDKTLVRRSSDLVKRVPADRGIAKMNCKTSPQACQNACYYQNCIRGGQQPVYYTEPQPHGVNTASRAQAGVELSSGTPCQWWPFGQRFWNTATNLNLQTDEWPMNTMQRDNFNPAATTPQVSLRCIEGTDNTRGGAHITQFRRGIGPWNTNGRFAADRLGGPGPLEPGDWYQVEFYMGDFDENDARDLAIYETLSYCFDPPDRDCSNDGLQFHLTGLQLNAGGNLGLLGYPYDNALHNTYRLTGEPADVRQFHLDLDITGTANDQVEAYLFVFNNGADQVIAQRAAAPMANGASFTLPASGTLPLALKVDRTGTGCNDFTVTYGDPSADGIRWFTFTSRDSAWPNFAPDNGRYCVRADIPDLNNPGQTLPGVRLRCSFPAW
ncbi:hypothetical protein PRZ48_001205 [Zasmidium cellare]|uniref:Uncharacterized protein n=1 Tax=Zasmidium cellare TaxID=395010 RepID=A0ABR0F1A8_ZASCE|nr:hypothetical protein PRZ48_001205 [Zasmidium cellare]